MNVIVYLLACIHVPVCGGTAKHAYGNLILRSYCFFDFFTSSKQKINKISNGRFRLLICKTEFSPLCTE